ncbi:hypothetical protein ACHAXT_001495 [Thalassiosira profunda]
MLAWKFRLFLAAALVGANARASLMAVAAASRRGAVLSDRWHRSGQYLQSTAAVDHSDQSHADKSDASINDEDTPAANNAARLRTRFRARAAYHGTPFHGWQLQPGKSTVLGEIESVLALRFRRRVPVLGAGRTDAGVHARGQAVHFDLYPAEMPFSPPRPPDEIGATESTMAEGDAERCADFVHELQHSMNRMLPLDIRIFNLQLAPYNWITGKAEGSDRGDLVEELPQQSSFPRARPWHVLACSTSKWYSYRLALGPTLWNPMDRFTRTHFVHRPSFAPSSSHLRPSKSASVEPYALTTGDIDRLREILRLYEGTHEFKAFGGQLEQTERRDGRKMNTIRTVYRVELVKEPLKEDYSFGDCNDGIATVKNDQLGFIGEEGYYRIDFLLQGALYKMVRNMVGTAMEVWMGRMREEQLIELLRIRDERDESGGGDALRRKDNPCKPAPPEGLTLECVYYENQF